MVLKMILCSEQDGLRRQVPNQNNEKGQKGEYSQRRPLPSKGLGFEFRAVRSDRYTGRWLVTAVHPPMNLQDYYLKTFDVQGTARILQNCPKRMAGIPRNSHDYEAAVVREGFRTLGTQT